jgi:hypothetical protein
MAEPAPIKVTVTDPETGYTERDASMAERPGARRPFELWQQAGGDAEEYRRLMREHGHLVPGEPEPLPCGWPGDPAARRQCCPMDTYDTDSAGNMRAVCTCEDGCACTCTGCQCAYGRDDEP